MSWDWEKIRKLREEMYNKMEQKEATVMTGECQNCIGALAVTGTCSLIRSYNRKTKKIHNVDCKVGNPNGTCTQFTPIPRTFFSRWF